MYLKVLMADYEEHYVVIELIGEWNDAIENDIMELKREVTDKFFAEGITKFILIAENILNFHSDGRDYYEEWFEEVTDENGWIAVVNMPEQTQQDFRKAKLNRYLELVAIENWRTYKPIHLFRKIDELIMKRIK
jgi:MFS superfamily sulfate permease-like transporter